jgi:SecD/SecF fusion protein
MQRNFLRGLLICLVPCLVATLFAIRPVMDPSKSYRLGIDLAGGTILVYEVNLERTKLRQETEKGTKDKDPKDGKNKNKADGLDPADMAQLAAQIKRRIDPTDIKNVTVRPSGDRRVEIILPTGGSSTGRAALSAEDVEEAKRLISQMGVLEFRILANGPDDKEGIIAARQLVADAFNRRDQKMVDPRKADGKEEDATELQTRAVRGLPPPPPEGEFNVTIGDTKAQVRYAWVELGPEYREEHGLSNAQAGSTPLGLMLAQRDHAIPDGGDVATCSALYYSRDCMNAELLAKEVQDIRRAIRDEKLPRSLLNKPDGSPRNDAELHAAALADPEAAKVVNFKKVEYFVLTRISPDDSLRVGGDITLTANPSTDSKTFNPCISFTFNGAGGQLFGKITRRNKPSGGHSRLLAVILDERLVSAATIQSEITTQGQITGKFDRKKVERDVQIMRSGSLLAELREKPVSENTIGPTLGADTIRRGTRAVGFAFLAILAFMVVYYRFAGFVACVALFANLLLTIGFMVSVNAAFTLAGLAGLVLTLGMAVDANVLIYERLREERNKGANIATAIRNGYDRAFLTIIDTHLTSIFTAIVLYVMGNDNLKGFAISLAVGLIISLFTSLYMTRLLFDFWLHKRWLTELKMMRLFERPNFNPMKYRWFFFPFTGALTILGLVLFLHRGEKVLNVDFRGGTVFAGKLKSGEERGLTATPDGKPGYRELLSEDAQNKRLAVAPGDDAVLWENREDTAANVWNYTITYTDGTKATVTLTEKPTGDTPEQMREDVRHRAGHLPDVSVEQTFLATDSFDMGKSALFTVRTTEKQRELVQVALDRLMRTDDGKASLLDSATMTYPTQQIEIEVEKNGKKEKEKRDVPILDAEGRVKLSFDKPTSRNFVQERLVREFKKIGADAGDKTVDLTPVGEEVDGRVKEMRLSVANNPILAALRPGSTAPPADRNAQLVSLAGVLNDTKRAFDSTPEPLRLEVFDSQLASETRRDAARAIALSWIAILLYLWFRFGNWTFGLASVICLVHDLCFTLGAIAVCHYLHLIPGLNFLGIEDFKIDLAAVAALLTLVGYSVNEIIVNFARIREVRGKNPLLTPQMINDSVNQTLSRTILTSMTVLLVSIVLYAFGGEGVHLFAFVMMTGVLVSTYSSIFVASPLLLFLGEGRDANAPTEDTTTEKEEGEGAEEEVVEG